MGVPLESFAFLKVHPQLRYSVFPLIKLFFLMG